MWHSLTWCLQLSEKHWQQIPDSHRESSSLANSDWVHGCYGALHRCHWHLGLFLFKLTGGGRQQSRESCPLNITEHAGSCWVLHPGRGWPVWMGNPWVVTVVTVYDMGTDPWCIFERKEGGRREEGEIGWLHDLVTTETSATMESMWLSKYMSLAP